MARRRRRLVFGEPVDIVSAALTKLHAGPGDREGFVTFSATFDDEQATSFVRALLRAEAAVLRAEADALLQPANYDPLDTAERQGRALLLLAEHTSRSQHTTPARPGGRPRT